MRDRINIIIIIIDPTHPVDCLFHARFVSAVNSGSPARGLRKGQ
jgi:hypothetical protein